MTTPVAESPLAALQRGLYQLLDAGLLVPVYDFVPEAAAFPYVRLGEATEIPDHAHRAYGSETTHTLHVWTKAEGFASGLAIVAEMTRLLEHRQADLAVSGHRVVSIRHDMTRTMLDPNPALRHIPVRYRIVTEQIMKGA